MSLCESTLREEISLEFLLIDLLITLDDDLMNTNLLLLVNNDIKNYLILLRNILTLIDLDISILISLIIEILLGKNLRTVEHVWSNLATLEQAQFLLHILYLRLLQTDIVDI